MDDLRARAAVTKAGLWDALNSDWLLLDGRIDITAESRPSVKLGLEEHLPPVAALAAMQASTMARLSAAWQVACTITLRAKPR